MVIINVRHLKGEDLTSLHPKELIQIEEALENGLTNVRDKQVSSSNLFCFGREGPKIEIHVSFNQVNDSLNVCFSHANLVLCVCNVVCLCFFSFYRFSPVQEFFIFFFLIGNNLF